MSDACESSSSCEEEEEPEGMMDLSPQSCCQQESLLLHYIFFSQVFSHHLHILKLSLKTFKMLVKMLFTILDSLF